MAAPLITFVVKLILSAVAGEVASKAVKKLTQPKEFDMAEMVMGLIRHALTTAGGYLAAKGVMATSEAEVVVGAIVALLGVAWSMYIKRKEV